MKIFNHTDDDGELLEADDELREGLETVAAQQEALRGLDNTDEALELLDHLAATRTPAVMDAQEEMKQEIAFLPARLRTGRRSRRLPLLPVPHVHVLLAWRPPVLSW